MITGHEYTIRNPYHIESEKYINYVDKGEVRNNHKHQQTCARNRKNRKKRK